MILYKYASFAAARSIVESNSIGFTCLEDLNDPFECTALGFSQKPSENVPLKLAYNAYKTRFSRNYALLSLSEEPLNSLMWAHYGDSFQGVVIGIDVEKAGFTSRVTSVVPAQLGKVEYIKEKRTIQELVPTSDELMEIGADSIAHDSRDYNLLKRAFLFKSAEWSYEKEIRVVKNISSSLFAYHSGEGRWKSESGCWSKMMINDRPLYCYQMPKECIVEVILGAQVYRNVSRARPLMRDEYSSLLSRWKKRMKVNVSETDVFSWNLLSKPYDPHSDEC